MGDFLPCALPYSGLLHACDTFAGPALCRPDGPQPVWTSPYGWEAFAGTPMCPWCHDLMHATAELADVEQEVARW